MSEVKKLTVESFLIIGTVLMFAIAFLAVLDGAVENPFMPNQITGMVTAESEHVSGASVGGWIAVVVGIAATFEVLQIIIRLKKENVEEHVRIRRVRTSSKSKR